METIVPSRITEAREARAMSMEELADRVGITRQSISKYERGINKPTVETLKAISYHLSYPIEFFYKLEKVATALSSPLFFRSNSNIAKKVKNACLYPIKWMCEIRSDLERFINFIDINIPSINVDYEELQPDDIENIALIVRKEWGLGEGPIGDLIGVLENSGILIGRIPTNDRCPFKGIEAFSSWRNGVPYIFYHPNQKSAVRTRFSILHELGHLIMHNSITDGDAIKKDIIDLADTQADRFAAAFLLPATSFPNDLHGSSLASLELIKHKWGVALSTIIRRCDTLELLSVSQLEYARRQMTIKKYWNREPLDDVIVIDGPEVLKNAIIMLMDNHILSKSEFLWQTAIYPDDLTTLCCLPSDYFRDCDYRQKPLLKVVNFN